MMKIVICMKNMSSSRCRKQTGMDGLITSSHSKQMKLDGLTGSHATNGHKTRNNVETSIRNIMPAIITVAAKELQISTSTIASGVK